MRNVILPFALALAASSAAAQGGTSLCARELDWASTMLARNYAGYADKVTERTRPTYDSLLVRLRGEAEAATTEAACNAVLLKWIAWFRDNHVSIARPGAARATPAAQPSPDSLRARFAAWERLEVGDEAAVRARLEAAGAARDPIEGIWESSDGSYRVAVVRDPKAGDAPREFAMVILRADSAWWVPGQVKATMARGADGAYATRFFLRDHSERQWEARPGDRLLAFSGGAPWLRRWPATDTIPVARYRASLNTRFDAREVAPGTVVVSVPTFNDHARMDSLWAVHGDRIRKAERLVIDLRGNGGGSDYNFREFLPLIYTDVVRLPSNWIYATDDNLAANEALARDTVWPKAQRDWIGAQARAARRERDARGWWKSRDDTYRNRRRALPREVAIIQDGGCASSCEGFLMRARQSSKTTTYGSNSSGVFDYGNVRDFRAPFSNLVLKHPSTKSGYLPALAIDNVGLPPQVPIPPGEPFPVEWVLRRMGTTTADAR